MWSLSIQNPLDHGDHEKIYCATIDRGGTISPDEKLYALGLEKERDRGQIETDRRVKEGEDIIYTSVTPKPEDEKSHRVRLAFDTCCPQLRLLADILWVRRLFDQHFQRDIKITV